MPVYRQRLILEIAKGLKAFLSLEAGVGRSAPWSSENHPGSEQRGQREAVAKKNENLKKLRVSVAQKNETIASLQRRLAETAESDGGASAPAPGQEASDANPIDPQNMIWIFGSGRSGSTWLRSMMSELDEHRVWEEPMVGLLFGRFYSRAQTGQLGSANFIMSNPTRKGWMRSVRNFVLDGARYAHPRLRPENYLVVKEPNGSVGAPLIMEAIPESRMILLIRDPRDVVASVLDATRNGGWLYEQKSGGAWKENSVADKNPDGFVKMRAQTYLRDAGGAARAYREHKGPKTLVRYEELVEDTLGTVSRIYSELGLPVDEAQLAKAVEKHSWENVPEEKKGEGKFYRKGASGGWKEDLTEKQIQIVENIIEPLLKEFYQS